MTGPIASFMFHEVTDDPASSGFQRPGARPYTCGTRRFDEFLDRIADSGRTPSFLGAAFSSDDAPRLLITFDDGGKSAVWAADRLLKRGWRGHFFIVTGRIGKRGFVDRDELRYLHSCGHLVGSHSHSHPDIFPRLTLTEMAGEWAVSRAILEHLLGERCSIASLPGGDLSSAVRESVQRAGFRAFFTSEPWLSPRRAGATLLVGRFAVKAGLTAERFSSLLALRGWSGALARRRCSVILRAGLGPLYRRYVQHRTAADRLPVGSR